MVFLSIIIPSYNSANTIVALLSSITASKKINFGEVEIVIVDDGSTDETVRKVEEFPLTDNKLLKPLNLLKIIKLKKNGGPAAARNIGVRYAKGKVVLFLDADVVLYKNTLFETIRSFQDDPDLYALTGVWDKKQKSDKFFPKFKALRDWSYWINERNPRDYYYLFSTRVAAIDRELFLRLEGFDTTYKTALVEDIELTYRIARRYAVVFNPKVMVHHEFEDFSVVARKYFWRSFYWSKIYRQRKKFDPVATTSKEAVTTISAGGVVILSGVTLLSYLSDLGRLRGMTGWLVVGLALVSLIHLWGVRKFIWFCLREEGTIFAIKAFFTGIALYLVILAGAAASILF
jgi:glycosyltransferase involved in cell wall biosynthesis